MKKKDEVERFSNDIYDDFDVDDNEQDRLVGFR